MMNIRTNLFSCLSTSCLALLIVSAGGCSVFDSSTRYIASSLTPYRIDIVQGNFISKEMVDLLKPGMSRDQVRFVLGAPLVRDIFHQDRWDYAFSYMPGSGDKKGQVEKRNVTIFFDGDRMTRYSASENLPSENEFVARIDATRSRERTSIWGSGS